MDPFAVVPASHAHARNLDQSIDRSVELAIPMDPINNQFLKAAALCGDREISERSSKYLIFLSIDSLFGSH
jgi:hypothetical protein